MTELAAKYNQLDPLYQQEVIHFIEFLLQKNAIKSKQALPSYKEKILQVSVWNEKDIEVITENQQIFNQWKIQSW
jgi:hypothetical protein